MPQRLLAFRDRVSFANRSYCSCSQQSGSLDTCAHVDHRDSSLRCFRICFQGVRILILTPAATSTIAVAIAANDYCLYRFEGRKRRENRDLHDTSTHFDEPECLTLISGCDQVVAVHGCQGDEQLVYIGGLDLDLRDAIRGRFEAVGIITGIHDDPDLQGINSKNICNRLSTRKNPLEAAADLS
jgi:hypothetical protein